MEQPGGEPHCRDPEPCDGARNLLDRGLRLGLDRQGAAVQQCAEDLEDAGIKAEGRQLENHLLSAERDIVCLYDQPQDAAMGHHDAFRFTG